MKPLKLKKWLQQRIELGCLIQEEPSVNAECLPLMLKQPSTMEKWVATDIAVTKLLHKIIMKLKASHKGEVKALCKDECIFVNMGT